MKLDRDKFNCSGVGVFDNIFLCSSHHSVRDRGSSHGAKRNFGDVPRSGKRRVDFPSLLKH